MISRCAKCGKMLSTLDIIIAYNGKLYCSKECTGCNDTEALEEVSTSDILVGEYLDRYDIMEVFETLANTSNSWLRFVKSLKANETEEFWNHLENKRFKDIIGLIIYMEGGI